MVDSTGLALNEPIHKICHSFVAAIACHICQRLLDAAKRLVLLLNTGCIFGDQRANQQEKIRGQYENNAQRKRREKSHCSSCYRMQLTLKISARLSLQLSESVAVLALIDTECYQTTGLKPKTLTLSSLQSKYLLRERD